MSHILGYVDKPADGWELIKRDLGFRDDAIPTSGVLNPYVVLYNKYTGMLRVFVAVGEQFGGYNFAEIKLAFQGRGASKTAGTLNKMHGIGVALENTTPGLSNEFASVTTYLNQRRKWFMADFPMDYAPCACQFDSKLRIDVSLISSLDVQLRGVASGTIASANVNNPGAAQTSSDFDAFGTVYKKTSIAVSKGQKTYKSLNQFASGVKKWLGAQPPGVGSTTDTQTKKDAVDSFKAALSGDSFLRQGLSAMPYIGFAVSALDSFFGGGKAASPQPIAIQPMALEMSITMNGTITTSHLYQQITFNNPGTRPTTAISEYPYYNEAMGVFSLLRQPVVRRKCTDYLDGSRVARLNYQYQVPNVLQYAINPSARLQVQEFQVAILQECSYYPSVLPAGWVFEGMSVSDTGPMKYVFRTAYRDAGCLQRQSFSLTTRSRDIPGASEIDIEGGERIWLKFMINMRRTTGTSTDQNVLLVAKYPVTLEESYSSGAVTPWPPVAGAQCLMVLPQITTTALQTFCTSATYAAAVALPRLAQEPDTAISRLAHVPLEVSIYPNPANEQVAVRFNAAGATARLTLFDALGRVVYTGRVVASATVEMQEMTVPVNRLPVGLYQCVVESGGRRQVRQLSVQH